MACRLNKQNEWTSRILQEASTTPFRSWFLTLTYDDDQLPRSKSGEPTLRKKDVQNWLKRIRKTAPVRYFAVGEYGDITNRPHYHVAIFPASNQEYLFYEQQWKKGHTLTTELIRGRCAYLARYTVKKHNQSYIDDTAQDIEPEWSIQSRKPALGYQMAQQILSSYQNKEGSDRLAKRGDIEKLIRLEGKKYPIGRYGIKLIREALGIPSNYADREKKCGEIGEYFPLQYPVKEDNVSHMEQQERLKRGQKTQILRSATTRI